jgi:MFS family permease
MDAESAPACDTAASPKSPPPALLRWTVLILISLALFGNYYAYDSIGPLADSLQRLLGFTDTQIGTLNAIYSFPNIVMVLVGGVIVDRVGTRLATVLFASVCLVGAVVTALSPSFKVMALGRLLYGLGAESMIVAITVAIGQWFVGRQLGFAFGVNLSIARAGSWAADISPTWAKSFYDRGWQPPLWLAAALAGTALLAAIAYFLVERAAARKYDLAAAEPTDRIVWGDLVKFDRSFWLVMGLCVAFYAVVFPFRSTFSIKYFQHAHGLGLEAAGAMNSHVFLAAIFATPLFGLLVDRVGHRALFMATGSLCLFAAFPLMAYTHASLWWSTVLLGVAFSLVPAVIWPAVPYLVEAKRLGTAYGLMTMLQNIGMMVFNLAAGMLNDANRAGEAHPGGYLPMLGMFAVLSLIGFGFAMLLRLRETGSKGHGLEQAKPGI